MHNQKLDSYRSIHVGVEQKYWPFNLVKPIHKNEYPIRRYHLIWFMQIQVCSDFAVCFQYVSQLLGKYLYRSWCLVYSNYVNFVMGYNPKVYIYIYIYIYPFTKSLNSAHIFDIFVVKPISLFKFISYFFHKNTIKLIFI